MNYNEGLTIKQICLIFSGSFDGTVCSKEWTHVFKPAHAERSEKFPVRFFTSATFAFSILYQTRRPIH